MIIKLIFLFLLTGAPMHATVFSFVVYYTDITQFPDSHAKLESILQEPVSPIQARIHEYEDTSAFMRATGAPYWIRGFTNHSGIYIQSRHLLRNQYDRTLEHELLHWTIKHHTSMPAWMEEGLVCWVTGELDPYTHITPMESIELRSIQELQNPWEMIAFSLGAMKMVQSIFGYKEDVP